MLLYLESFADFVILVDWNFGKKSAVVSKEWVR